MSRPVLILGCGFTGRRVARRLLARGVDVTVTSRRPEALALPGARTLRLDVFDLGSLDQLHRATPPDAVVVHSVPVVEGADPTPVLLDALGHPPARVVYLSTTGVYGRAKIVDETTPIAPDTPRVERRAEAERHVASGSWSWLILRPAAIYGPGRGVHVSMLERNFPLVEGGHNFTSRIHVDDLAAHVEAAIDSSLTGAYPVADEEPCPSLEIATFCANLLGVPLPESVSRDQASETRRADRRVDGGAIRRQLGLTLRYPSYRTGIPASLDAAE